MPTPFALVHATVLTGDAATTVLTDHTVVVDEGGVISAVAPSAAADVPAGYRQVDVAGKVVTPGIINAHVHLFSQGKPLPALFTSAKAEQAIATFTRTPAGRAYVGGMVRRSAATLLRSGVTTARSLGDVGYEVAELAARIESGKGFGPRMLASGPLLAVSGGHGAPQIALVSDSPWEARRSVRLNLRGGATAIKIAATGGITDAKYIGEAGRPQMTEAEMAAICDEAHTAGLVVAAHAQSTEGIRRALRAGVDTIEHGAQLTDELLELFRNNPNSLRGWSALVPTLHAGLPLVKLPREATGASDVVYGNSVIIVEGMLQGVRDALAAGVTIGVGTDSAMTYVTQYSTWRELDYLVRFGGLRPEQALHAAWGANARILGLEDVTGMVVPGLAADLLILDNNPLGAAGVRALAAPRAVIAGGRMVADLTVPHFTQIDELLDSF